MILQPRLSPTLFLGWMSWPQLPIMIIVIIMVMIPVVLIIGMALTYRFERYGLDLPSLILHTLVSPIKSLQQAFFTYSSKDMEIALQKPS
jgi:hypothetical protein